MSAPDLVALARRVVEGAAGGEQVEAYVVHEAETEVRAFGGDVESLTSATAAGLGVRVVRNGRQGFAYAGTLDDEALGATLAEARDNADFATEDEHAGVAEPDGVEPVELDLHDDRLGRFDPAAKVDLALDLERVTLGADPRIAGVEAAAYADSTVTSAIVTSTGIETTSSETTCYVLTYALAEAAGETQTGYGWSIGREPGELDIEQAGNDAARRATRMLGAVKPSSERLTVVLDPYVTAQLLEIIGSTLTGDAVQKGRSLFADRLGDAVASSAVTLVDDATEPRAFTASAVDAEGLATRATSLIGSGVLGAYLHDSYTGRRGGGASTGSAVRAGFKSTPGVGAQALRLEPGSRTQAELVAGIDNGVLVQEVTGLHSGVNPVSGDFSTGVEGMRIRDGALAEPIREATIASTLQRLLLDVSEVGSDLEWLPMSAAGVSVVVSDMMLSGS